MRIYLVPSGAPPSIDSFSGAAGLVAGVDEARVALRALALSITASLQRAGKGIRLVIGGGAANAIDSGLASLVARAISSRAMLFSGQDDSVEAMAARLGVRRDYLAVLLRLSYLSPDIVRAILAGQHPVELTPTRLIALSRGFPQDWQEQKRVLGFPAP